MKVGHVLVDVVLNRRHERTDICIIDIMLAAKISPEDGAIQKAQQMIQKKWQQWKTTTELDSAAQRNSDQKHDALVNPTRTSKKKKNRRKSPLSRELKNSRQVEESPKNVNPRHVVKLHFTPLTPDKNRIQHPMETHPRPASTTALDLQNERATLVAMPLPAKQRIIISSLIKQADARVSFTIVMSCNAGTRIK